MSEKYLSDYWLKHYCKRHCTICGNAGVIDSRGVCTPAGIEVGRLNWCICPNGRMMRIANGERLPKTVPVDQKIKSIRIKSR